MVHLTIEWSVGANMMILVPNGKVKFKAYLFLWWDLINILLMIIDVVPQVIRGIVIAKEFRRLLIINTYEIQETMWIIIHDVVKVILHVYGAFMEII
jgi:hypothetical protein